MPAITSNSIPPLHYRKMGAGPALVLIHGFPENSLLWRNIWHGLSHKFTLIIPDLPGSGDTPLAAESSLEQMAAGINAILQQEGIGKSVLAGHSMGGYVAAAYAARYPEQVAGLSFVHSTPLADDAARIENRQKAIDIIQKGGKELYVRQLVSGLFAPGFTQQYPEQVALQIAAANQTTPEALINFQQAMIQRPDHTAMLKQATYPVQWVIGTEDNVIAFKKMIQLCYISPVNFVTFYQHCGHMGMIEVPEQLQEDLANFTAYCYMN